MCLALLADSLTCPVPCLLPSDGRLGPDWCPERSQGEQGAYETLNFGHPSGSQLLTKLLITAQANHIQNRRFCPIPGVVFKLVGATDLM